MWVNVKRAETARGAFVGGQQMYVEYMIPAQVRHPFPVVLVHGGGGQGTDWMGTPDGRPGWFQYLVAGRLQGLRRRSSRARTIAASSRAARRFPGAGADAREHRGTIHAAEPRIRRRRPNEYQKNHNQWPGPGNVGSTDLDQLVAGHGRQLRRAARRRGGRGGGARAAPGAAWWTRPVLDEAQQRRVRRRRRTSAAGRRTQRAAPGVASGRRGSARQDRSRDHHDALGRRSIRLLVAEARPNLVKATVIIEGAGSAHSAVGNRWGMSSDSRSPTIRRSPIRRRSRRKWVGRSRAGRRRLLTCRKSRRASCRI